MLEKDLFKEGVIKRENMIRNSFLTLANFNDDNNTILKVDNLEETVRNVKHIFRAEEAIQIATIFSEEMNQNVFLINEVFNDNLKNNSTSLMDNFYKLYAGLNKIVLRKHKALNVSILNMQCPVIHHENQLASDLYLPSLEANNDIAILRNLQGVNIFSPADATEADYLLKMVEKDFYKEGKSNFSYFKLISEDTPKIFDGEYFERDGHLKEWNGLPELVYMSKTLEANYEVGLIATGPILYNVLLAAKDLEDQGYKVQVLNVSLISANSEYLNSKIREYLNNFCQNNKNIITIEEHSKIGGLGSLVSEIVAQNKSYTTVKVESLGVEDNLSPRNIISKAEEISGY